MKNLPAIFLLAIGSLSASHLAAAQDAAPITPYEAVKQAASKPVAGVNGVFEVHVLSSAEQHGYVLLNSEPAMRDARNLTISLSPDVAFQLEHQLGGNPRYALKGKTLMVTGVARQVTTHRSHGERHQTVVAVTDPAQIRITD
ncbi:MAG: hypothetical protein V4463_07045 [Pseudomonadota bacterium]